MKKIMIIVLLAVLFVGIGVYADDILTATGIRYKNRTVESSLNELYIKANAKDNSQHICKLIDETYGSFGNVGSKYECEVGPNIKYNFYLLSKENGIVNLIMDRNITQGTSAPTMTWTNAMKFFDDQNVAGGIGVQVKNSWTNVLDINLPNSQDIANVVNFTAERIDERGATGWFYFDSKTQSQTANASNLSQYRWLFDYTKNCANYGCNAETNLSGSEAIGYWTENMICNTTTKSWDVCYGKLDDGVRSDTSNFGVRPVITVLTTNLYTE